jgi:hypothetical protein
MTSGRFPLLVAVIVTSTLPAPRRPPAPARLFVLATPVVSTAVSIRSRFIRRTLAVAQLGGAAAGITRISSAASSTCRRSRPVLCPCITVASVGTTVRMPSIRRCRFSIPVFLLDGRISPTVASWRGTLAPTTFVLALAWRALPSQFLSRGKRGPCWGIRGRFRR